MTADGFGLHPDGIRDRWDCPQSVLALTYVELTCVQ